MSARYDHWILTLAGGGLAISLTLMEKIAPQPLPETLVWVKRAWALLVISLLGALLSLLTSQSAIREQRRELDQAYQNQAPVRHKPRKWFTRLTNLLNWLDVTVFVLGITSLCVFSFSNLP